MTEETQVAKTELVTEEQLDGLPKKTLLKIAEGLGLSLPTRTTIENIIEAILEAQQDELDAEELGNAPPSFEDNTSDVVKSAKADYDTGAGKQMFDMNTLTLETLAAMRPDLINKINKTRLDNVAKHSKGQYAKLQKWSVTIGPMGPGMVEAFTSSDALQKFQKAAGILSFTQHVPQVVCMGEVEETEETEETEEK